MNQFLKPMISQLISPQIYFTIKVLIIIKQKIHTHGEEMQFILIQKLELQIILVN